MSLILTGLFARYIIDAWVELPEEERERRPLNVPLLVAAAYMGLLVWHGGLSSSVFLKANSEGALLFSRDVESIPQDEYAALMSWAEQMPEQFGIEPGETITSIADLKIPVADTLLAPQNGIAALAMIVIVPFLFWRLSGHRFRSEFRPIQHATLINNPDPGTTIDFDSRFGIALSISVSLLGLVLLVMKVAQDHSNAIDLDFVILLFLFLGVLLFRRPNKFIESLSTGAERLGPIVVCFLLYWGIFGILHVDNSFLVNYLADAVFNVMYILRPVLGESKAFVMLVYILSCVVNLFVPSGGAQWMLQGPIVFAAGGQLDTPVDPSQLAMAIAYGDQTTNMIQPFWALPILAICRASLREVMGFAAIFCAVGVVIYSIVLLTF